MSGRTLLGVPGPTNVPDRVRRAMDRPVLDHRGPELPGIVDGLVAGMRELFGTREATILFYPGSGTAMWESALANTLSPGDRVLAFDNGHFSHLWADCARAIGLAVDEVSAAWGDPLPLDALAAALTADSTHEIKAVLVVHNETSTGVTTPIAGVRETLDRTGHPAMLFLDTVSSLGSIEVSFDAWRVDVALTGSQKGLMLPPGMGIIAAGERALAANAQASLPRYFLDWRAVIDSMETGYFPYTPATLLLLGLQESLAIFAEEGLPELYARHARFAQATRAAVDAWGLGILCSDPGVRSNTATAIVTGGGLDPGRVLSEAHAIGLSLGGGLGQVKGTVFRIGHIGSLNAIDLLGILGGTELALQRAGHAFALGSGVAAALDVLATS